MLNQCSNTKRKCQPIKRLFLWLISLGILLSSCGEKELIRQLQDIDISQSETGIVPLPGGYHKDMNAVFAKYTKITAQNGRPIHFFAPASLDDEKIILIRETMRMYLTPVLGSKYGSVKFFVGNAMANANAAMFIFKDQAHYTSLQEKLGSVPFTWQFTLAEFTHVPGDSEYMKGESGVTLEETLHLLHDAGITPVLPLFQEEIDVATDAAVNSRLYVFNHVGFDGQAPEADKDQEYFAGVLYAYYEQTTSLGVVTAMDLGIETDIDSKHRDNYLPRTRAEVKKQDPLGYALIEAFFPPYLTYNARIYHTFEGDFSLTLAPDAIEKPGNPENYYTYRSQYLQHATLTGKLHSGLIGNARDNRLTGNIGNNSLTGKQGDDMLDGGGGIDTVFFTGVREDYLLTTQAGVTIISDQKSDRDGRDSLKNIEYVKFSNITLAL